MEEAVEVDTTDAVVVAEAMAEVAGAGGREERSGTN